MIMENQMEKNVENEAGTNEEFQSNFGKLGWGGGGLGLCQLISHC